MLNRDTERLVQDNLDLVPKIAWRYRRLFPILPQDEMKSVLYLAMVSSADRWEAYCAEHGYSPDSVEYFRPYATRRMKGSIADTLRELDPLSRAQRKQVKESDGKTSIETISGHLMSGYLLEPEDGILESFHSKEPSPHSQSVASTALAELVKTIREFPLETQVILALYYYKEMMLQEVAAELNTTESRVSKTHTDAVLVIAAKLRISLSD